MAERDTRFGGNMERANVGKPNVSVNWGGRDVPAMDLRYENYRAPYRAEYSPSRNPHHPSHANRTIHTDDQGRMFGRNMRGKDKYNINVGPRPERDTTGLGGLINRLDTGNVGFTDILNRNPFNKLFPQSWYDAVGEDRYFNQDYKDWNDRFGDDYMISGQPFISQDNISSERQPGLEGGMGEGIGSTNEYLMAELSTPQLDFMGGSYGNPGGGGYSQGASGWDAYKSNVNKYEDKGSWIPWRGAQEPATDQEIMDQLKRNIRNKKWGRDTPSQVSPNWRVTT
jgi:hypothetical protein